MAPTATRYEHVALREDGVPIIMGTTTKVVEIAAEAKAWEWDARQIHVQHDYLTLGQIHSALAYYWDHVDEFDRQIEESAEELDRLRGAPGRATLRSKLKSGAISK